MALSVFGTVQTWQARRARKRRHARVAEGQQTMRLAPVSDPLQNDTGRPEGRPAYMVLGRTRHRMMLDKPLCYAISTITSLDVAPKVAPSACLLQPRRGDSSSSVRSLEGLQRVSGGEIESHHTHLGTAGNTYRFDQLPIAAAEAATPVSAAERITGVNPLARTHAVAPVQVSCAAW